jgi:hypothetical protein
VHTTHRTNGTNGTNRIIRPILSPFIRGVLHAGLASVGNRIWRCGVLDACAWLTALCRATKHLGHGEATAVFSSPQQLSAVPLAPRGISGRRILVAFQAMAKRIDCGKAYRKRQSV